MEPGEFKISRATRRGVIPLIGLYGESGTGKTMTALLIARGLVGSAGEIHVIDTESRRGSIYADVIPGGYSVLDLDAPFTPDRYIQALDTVFRAGAKVAVVDSASHEWEGMDGVLDMASDNEQRSGRPGLHNWKQPKFEHAKFVQFLLRSPVPVVICIRAKRKTHQTKRLNPKTNKIETVIEKDEFASPVQADDFIFELTAHGEVLQDHSINLTKCSHPDLRKCFPEKGPAGIHHGELISKWCAAAGGVAQVAAPIQSPEDKANKSKLWKLTEHIHKGEIAALESYLVSGNFLEPGVGLSSISGGKLKDICAQVEEGLQAK